AGARGQVKGLYHDRSASGATVYVEPEGVVEEQNRLCDLMIDEEREVVRLLWRFTRRALDLAADLQRARSQVARFDLACARAAVAADLGLEEPVLLEAGALEVAEARHPLLLALSCDRAEGETGARLEAARRAVVPFSLRLGESFDVMVLTGPNTGGKTATLKAIGLLALLPRSGSFVPAAAGARIPWFPGVFADVGDEQDLTQSLSTFSGHISRISAILAAARPGALVLLDELGSGTDPLEGEALSAALLDHFLERGLLAVVTTHLGRLKEFAGRRPRAANASMQFDPDSLRPTYRLIPGIPGASNALRIARNLGVAREIIAAADALLGSSARDQSALFDQLDRARAAVERLRAE
ncbi:MAG: endonuclease MutS2, partial [Planctomycetes bacterium]|nr:endonuclease MutS2 [Planctomycetota bacterium]